MKQLDRRAVWLFFINYLIAISVFLPLLLFLIFYVFLMPSITALVSGSSNINWFWINNWPWGLFILFLFLILFGYVWARLSYHYYRYELGEDGFKKEHGVIWKKYVTIPYARIQNVDIYRGPLARILGLSDVQIQTAGMSTGWGSYRGGAEGRLLGVSSEEAERIRSELIKRAQQAKEQGL